MNRSRSSNKSVGETADAGGQGGVLFVGDIGGTNARFALFEATANLAGAAPISSVTLPTEQFSDALELFDQALSQLLSDTGTDRSGPVAACVAVAGPVAEGRAKLTNGELVFEEQLLANHIVAPVLMINDFYAVAASINEATPVLAVGQLSQPAEGVRAVIGPGTGLGMGYLVPLGSAKERRWQVMASEGGNADFAPSNALELELLGLLQQSQKTVSETISIETLVSGRGLPRIYAGLCELWGVSPQFDAPDQITSAALEFDGANGGDLISHKTLELFCAMLGTAAGNFALNLGSRGGVYLAGGILPRITDFFCASDFRQRFEDRGRMTDFVKQIPTLLVLDPEPGLTGAFGLAQQLNRRN